jgi:hypothetical protein
MEFTANVHGEQYQFSFINRNSVWVSSATGEYILYKLNNWRCADDVNPEIVTRLGQIIEEHLQVASPV